MNAEKKENILLVHNYYQIPGGEDTVVANEKKLLEEHGHRVVVYARSNNEIKEYSKIQKIAMPFTTIFNLGVYKEIKRLISENAIDIVHVHNTLNVISPAVYYAALHCKVPVVQTVHNFRLLCPGATFYRDGYICEDCMTQGIKCAIKHSCYRGSRIQTLACAVNTIIHRISKVYNKINFICLTEFTRQKMAKVYSKANMFIKPNFVYDAGGKYEPQDYYLFMGRLEEIKGVRLLVDAFANMPDKKLKIAGTGVLDQELKQKIQDEKLTNIELLGFKSRNEINELLKQARALIMCSQWYETFGMVIAEAYSNGTPVIVGGVGNIKDLVVEGSNGTLFRYNSVEDLQKAVTRFETMDIAELSRNAYAYYKEFLSPETNYQVLAKIYDAVKRKGTK